MTTLIRFEPRNVFKHWGTDFGHLFNGVENTAMTGDAWAPAVDVEDTGDAYVLRADVPGLEAKDIELELEHDVLTLKGERKIERKTEGERYAWTERNSGSFTRRFRLPETAGGEVSAKLANGVLEIRVPKPAKPKPVRIEVAS